MKPCSVFYPTLLCLFFSLFASAQKNFQDGFLVLPSNDTLRGQIDYREWTTTPRKISFLDTRTGRTTVYGPEDLRSFYVSGDYYASLSVRIYPYTFDPVVAGSDDFSDRPYEVQVFMRYLTGDRLELYHYADTTGVSYFFSRRKGAPADQLRVITRKIETTEKTGFVFDEVYRSQLAALMADCEALRKNIGRVSYKEGALRQLFFAYNNCGKDTVEKSTVHAGRRLFFTPVIGYLNSRISLGAGSPPWSQMQFPAYNTFSGGAGMLYILPRQRQQLAILTDLLYNHFHSHSNFGRANDYLTDDVTLDYNTWNLDLQFRYRFPTGYIRPFLEGGFSNSLVTGNKSIRHEHDVVGDRNDYYSFLGDGFQKYWIGWVAGAGVSAGRASLEFRASRGPGISSINGIAAPATNFYFLISYAL
jgi:hypothetical protein